MATLSCPVKCDSCGWQAQPGQRRSLRAHHIRGKCPTPALRGGSGEGPQNYGDGSPEFAGTESAHSPASSSEQETISASIEEATPETSIETDTEPTHATEANINNQTTINYGNVSIKTVNVFSFKAA